MWKQEFVRFLRQRWVWVLLAAFSLATGLFTGLATAGGLPAERLSALVGGVRGGAVTAPGFMLFMRMWLTNVQTLAIVWLCAYTRFGIPLSVGALWLRGMVLGFSISVGWRASILLSLGLTLTTLLLSALLCAAAAVAFPLSASRFHRNAPVPVHPTRPMVFLLICTIPIAILECVLLPVAG